MVNDDAIKKNWNGQ